MSGKILWMFRIFFTRFCNWLPIGTKLKITFPKNSEVKGLSGTTKIYTVEDTGGAARLKTHCIDVYIPNSHSKVSKIGISNIKISIQSMPSKYRI